MKLINITNCIFHGKKRFLYMNVKFSKGPFSKYMLTLKIGANCMFGGMVDIADNLTIVDNTVVFAKTAVTKSISEPGVYASVMQAQPIRRWRRLHAHFTRLMDLHKKVRNLGEKSYE